MVNIIINNASRIASIISALAVNRRWFDSFSKAQMQELIFNSLSQRVFENIAVPDVIVINADFYGTDNQASDY